MQAAGETKLSAGSTQARVGSQNSRLLVEVRPALMDLWISWLSTICDLRRFSRSPSSPGGNPAQRCALPQIQTFAWSSG